MATDLCQKFEVSLNLYVLQGKYLLLESGSLTHLEFEVLLSKGKEVVSSQIITKGSDNSKEIKKKNFLRGNCFQKIV